VDTTSGRVAKRRAVGTMDTARFERLSLLLMLLLLLLLMPLMPLQCPPTRRPSLRSIGRVLPTTASSRGRTCDGPGGRPGRVSVITDD